MAVMYIQVKNRVCPWPHCKEQQGADSYKTQVMVTSRGKTRENASEKLQRCNYSGRYLRVYLIIVSKMNKEMNTCLNPQKSGRMYSLLIVVN